MNITIDGDGFHVEGDVKRVLEHIAGKEVQQGPWADDDLPFDGDNQEDFDIIPEELKRCQLCNENLADTPIEQLTINGTSIFNVRACAECHGDL